MSLGKRLLFIIAAAVLLLVVGYFIYTGKNLNTFVPSAAPSEVQAL